MRHSESIMHEYELKYFAFVFKSIELKCNEMNRAAVELVSSC